MMKATDTCPICTDRDSEKVLWIQCSECKQWFHTQCLKLKEYEVLSIVAYHCRDCSRLKGPSILKRQSKRTRVSVDYVALNEGQTIALDKKSHHHLHSFLELKSVPNIEISSTLTKGFALKMGMERPILIPKAQLDIAGMKLPLDRNKITIDYITECCGANTPVEVMDVISQQGVSPSWKLAQWQEYFNTAQEYRDRIRNVISLEISSVQNLGTSFTRPQMVRDLDLVDKVWDPKDEQERSKVTKYCLMSVKDCFTDFHIDFGGTSVYYYVLKGCKTFLFYPPTDDNLALYTLWCMEPKQNIIWFPEYSKVVNKRKVHPLGGFKVTLQPGDLFIIPSGWIHCVHTPQDSIVFGGNFLTLRDMKMQLKIYDIERVTKVPNKFRFPMFNKVIWLSAWYYSQHKEEMLKDVADDKVLAIEIVDLWIKHLNDHYNLSLSNQVAKRSIPGSIKKPLLFIEDLRKWKESI